MRKNVINLVKILAVMVLALLMAGCDDIWFRQYLEDLVKGQEHDGILYVTNRGDASVTFFNAKTGDYLNGTLADSSFTTGTNPSGMAVNFEANILYVGNAGSNTITFFNAETGAYLNGTLANSSFSGGGYPESIAVNSAANILYASDRGGNSVYYFNAKTGAYINSINIGNSPRGMAVNPEGNLLYVAVYNEDSLVFLNARTGANLGSYVTNGSPWHVAVNPDANIVYAATYSFAPLSQVTYYNATTGAYMFTDLPGSSIDAGYYSMGIAVNPDANLMYVTNTANGGAPSSDTVTFYNAKTRAYMNGTMANSSFATEDEPFDVAVNPVTNILYVVNNSSDSVTFFNAKTGAYLNGTLANSTFTTGSQPWGVAVNSDVN